MNFKSITTREHWVERNEKLFRDNDLTYEDPEKAAAVPAMATKAKAVNFMVMMNLFSIKQERKKIVR